MSQADPHGYYSCLGLSPSALPAEIKRAYRARAMSLHPDRNQGQDTTAQFQQVVRAYEVLSNTDLRHQYDQLQFAPEPVAQTPEVWPVHCTRCGCVSPHSRFRSFSLVVGFVFSGLKTQTQGVFCERCEPKVAVRSTLVNVLAGWWSIQTVYANFQGLISNLRGGPFFLEQNARMMFMQAQHFRANGLKDVASALASQAYKMLSAHNPKTSWNRAKAWVADGWRLHKDPDTKKLILSKRLKALFSASLVHLFRFPKQVPSKESLDLLKQDLRFFLDQSEGKVQSTTVSSRSWWLGSAFMMQVILILCVFGGVFALSAYRPLLWQHLQPVNEVQDISPMIVQEQVVPSLNAVDLPISGVYQSSKPIETYATGLFPSLKLQAKPGHHYYVKLTDLNTGESEMSVFIRGGDEIEFPVSPGVYQVKFVWGNTWYGEQNLFGPEGLYKAFDVQFEFWKTDRKAQRSGLILDTENDNISRVISASEF